MGLIVFCVQVAGVAVLSFFMGGIVFSWVVFFEVLTMV